MSQMRITPAVAFLEFVVTGEPGTKGRHRVMRGGVRMYTPQQTKDAENVIAWEARAKMGARKPNLIDDLGVEIAFYGATRQRRDIDNMAKLVLDALNGVAWGDDNQITAMHLWKSVDPQRPRTEVRVYIEADRTRSCQNCNEALDVLKVKRDQVFCSKKCYDEAQRRGHYRMCVGCGATVYRKSEKAHAARVYCTRECRQRTWGKCRQCEGLLPRKGLAFCSSDCRRQWYDSRPAGGTNPKGSCLDCGRSTYNRTAVRCRPCEIDRRAPDAQVAHVELLALTRAAIA